MTGSVFDLPEGVLGELEWASGTLRINASLEEVNLVKRSIAHRRLMDGTHPDDQRAADLIRVITHEHFHFLQVITTGYPYSLACAVFSDIMRHLGEHMGPERTPEEFLSMIKKPLPPVLRVTQKFAEIDEPGPDGLTIRDVIESAALLYECKAHIPNLDHETYCQYLADKRVLPEYRRAYKLASKALGPTAFHNFLVAAAIALCFRWPHRVFGDVLYYMNSLAHLDAVYRQPEDLPGLLGIMPALRARKHQYFGTAGAMAKGNWEGRAPLVHPFYTQALNAALANHDEESLLLLTIDPRAIKPISIAVATQPVLFNDNVIQMPAGFEMRGAQFAVPAGYEGRVTANAGEEFVNTWIFMAAICQNVIAGTGHAMQYRIPPPLNPRFPRLVVQT